MNQPSGLEFLLQANGQPSAPTRCWIVATAGSTPPERSAWEVRLDEPDGLPDEQMSLIDDLKAWALFGDARRELRYRDPKTKQEIVREFRVGQVVERYVRAIRARLPEGRRHGPCWFLLPATEDSKAISAYRAALTRAAPGAQFLPEPEMVVEYFRLLRRDLVLQEGHNNAILVVDVGAATCNMTIVMSRRDQQLVGAKKGFQRTRRLRAIHGVSNDAAGRWVDTELARRLDIDLDALSSAVRSRMVAAIEQAKVRASRMGHATIDKHLDDQMVVIERDLLSDVAVSLCARFLPVFTTMCARLFDQVTHSESARKLNSELLAERGVSDASNAHKLIDMVLVSGGTSRLPDFEASFKKALFPERLDLPFLHVGPAFPVAAGVGGLLHVLRDEKRPPRLHSDDDADQPTFMPSLGASVVFGWKDASAEQRVIALDVDDRRTDVSGSYALPGMPAFAAQHQFQARLVPGPEAPPEAAVGRHFYDMVVSAPPGDLSLDWNAEEQEARISSVGIPNAGALFLDMKRVRRSDGAAEAVFEGEIPAGQVAVDFAPDIVFDIGMSKTVVVAARPGLVDPAALETWCESAWSTEPAGGESDGPSPGPPIPDLWSPEHFGPTLKSILTSLRDVGCTLPDGDLPALLLAAAIRPTVLIAGPPGCGKTSLVRFVARLLGTEKGRTFHEVAVQAHWHTDDPVFGADGEVQAIFFQTDVPHVLLFDEFNLTRPEYYVSRLLSALDGGPGWTKRNAVARCVVFGTLNVDDTSRPPSPKIVDRCFLMHMDAPKHKVFDLAAATTLPLIAAPALGFPGSVPKLTPPAAVLDRVDKILGAIDEVVRTEQLRSDLLPSRRARADVMSFLGLHDHLNLHAHELMTTDDAIDRVLYGRVLVRLCGAVEQVEPVLKVIKPLLDGLDRCARFLKLAETQSPLGFVSPWQ